jgi:hypothetical protein
MIASIFVFFRVKMRTFLRADSGYKYRLLLAFALVGIEGKRQICLLIKLYWKLCPDKTINPAAHH